MPCPCDHTVSLGDTWKSLAKQFKAPSGKWIKYLNPGSMKKPAVGEVGPEWGVGWWVQTTGCS